MNWRDQLDWELWHHNRLPRPDNSAGPTAEYMRFEQEREAQRLLWLLATEDQLELDVEGAA